MRENELPMTPTQLVDGYAMQLNISLHPLIEGDLK